MSLNDKRCCQTAVPRPFGPLLVSGSSPIEFRPTEALSGINRHHMDDRNVEPEPSPPRLERDVKTVLALAIRGGRPFDQNLATNAIFDPGSQPSYDAVMATDDMPSLFTLIHVDPPLVKGVPTDSAVSGNQGAMGLGVMISLGCDSPAEPPDDCNTKEGVLDPVILLRRHQEEGSRTGARGRPELSTSIVVQRS